MKLQFKQLSLLSFALVSALANAALDIGQTAPQFTVQVALAGNVSDYYLADELKKGPVVLYFFPMAFSGTCSIEAHNFAEAIGDFKKLGATVIGVSRDDIDTQKRFSVSECRGKFAVAADTDQKVMKAYDAVLAMRPDYANRVSYVIAPSGKIIYQYSSLNPAKHVQNTMNALKEWSQTNLAK